MPFKVMLKNTRYLLNINQILSKEAQVILKVKQENVSAIK